MQDATVLILPGWKQGAGAAHWQLQWVWHHADTWVEQNDWVRPRRGDWLARLDEVVVDAPGDVVFAAHGLACLQVAAWAAISRHTARVRGALLVAPMELESHDMKNTFPGWLPIHRARLPFASAVVGPANDPYCSPGHAQSLASEWGAKWFESIQVAPKGADSFSSEWPEGRALLQTF